MQRIPSSKTKWQPVGPISFSTNQEDDISGLDEAVQSLSKAHRTVPQDVPPASEQDSGLHPTVVDGNSSEPFELAVDATSIVDDELGLESMPSSAPNLSMETPNDDLGDVSFSPTESTLQRKGSLGSALQTDIASTDPILINGRSTNSETRVHEPQPSPSGSAPDIRMTPSAHDLDDSFTSPSRPIRPPPFQPRVPPELVAAADIHALLDSFTPPKGSGFLDSESPKRQAPPIPQCFAANSASPVLDEDSSSVSDQPLTFGGDTQPVFPSPSEGQSPSRVAPRSRSESLGSLGKLTTPVHPAIINHRLEQHGDEPRIVRQEKPRRPSKHRINLLAGAGLFVTAGIVLILASFYFFSAFAWGLFFGVGGTSLVMFIRRLLWPSPADSDVPICHLSGLPLGELCCSLHCQPGASGSASSRTTWWPIYAPAFPPLCKNPPRLRDLQPLAVPHMKDEDINSSASGGPLGIGLGFKFDKTDRPIYKGWMNEVIDYDPETHHVSRTHSVFLTLDGTQLRLQRPRRNISRRSMWNEELPSGSAARFQHQRIYDLVQARVILLPTGLVSKRLWSKKYPIAVTLPLQTDLKMGLTKSTKPSLPSSISAPNMHTPSVLNSSQSPVKSNSPATTFDVTDRKDSLRSPTPGGITDEDFRVVSHEDVAVETLYLFARTCREKEAWYRRLRAASLGVPLFWTPQLAAEQFLSGTPATLQDQRSDDDVRSEADASVTDSSVEQASTSGDKSTPVVTPQLNIPGNREPLYVTYVRYMAKYMPADWLLRGSQALHLNVNYISCDPSLLWLNAFLARIFWDFLREVYWLERVRDKIQAKLKKIHLPPFISDLVVVGIELGSELPIIRRIGRPHLDAHGLWFELDVAYAGGFSVALETNVNLLRWNQKNRAEREAANLADDTSGAMPSSGSGQSEQSFSPATRRSNKLGAFMSEEEDSADSTTDSEGPVETQPTGPTFSRRPSAPRIASQTGSTNATGKPAQDEDRPNSAESPKPGESLRKPLLPQTRSLQLPSGLPSRKRFIRLVDRIARSTYFQKAVDNKLVQRGMELLSNTPIVLEAEIQALSGTLLVNIPPPPSDRLWYGFQPNPQLRLKARPRVGEKAVTMSRILEWIENRVALEFQRLLVIPNMDDIPIPLLLSDVTAGETK